MKIYSPQIIGNTSVSGALNVQGDVTGSSMYLSNGAIIAGDLTVNGTVTYISSSTLQIGDNVIEINYNRAAGPSGMIVYDTTSPFTASMLWNDVTDAWVAGPYGAESPIILSNQTSSMSVASASFAGQAGTAGFATSASFASTASVAGTIFPFIGTATISGSIQSPAVNTDTVALRQGNIMIGGSGNTVPVGNAWNVVMGGQQNSITAGSTNGVFGGYISSITTAAGQNKNIYGAALSSITGTAESLTLLGGLQNALSATANQQVIVGGSLNGISASGNNNQINSGNSNTISGASANSVIIGGQSNTIAGRLRSVVLGGNGISATANDTVFVPNLDVSGSATVRGGAIITGSVQLRTTAAGGGIDIAYAGFPNTTSVNNIFAIGSSNTAASTTGGVIGTSNNLDATGNANFAFGISNTITSNGSGDNNMLLGRNNSLTGTSSTYNYSLGFSNAFTGNSSIGRVLVGHDHNSTAGSYNGVFAGNGNTVSHNNSVIIGGANISSSAANTVYVPNLDVSGSSIFKAATVFSGSVRGEVNALSITSNTASLNCALDNFFTLQLVAGTDTRIEPTNILPGQTINIRVNTTGSATVSFPSSVKQVSGSAYIPTTTTGVDVLTLMSFDSSALYLADVKNLV